MRRFGCVEAGPRRRAGTGITFLFQLVLWLGADAGAYATDSPVRVYAAVSLTNALETIAEAFREETGIPVVSSFAGSSTLARQIERSAPVDLFLSANTAWMDYLESKALIEEGSRTALLGNALVVITPKGEGFDVEARKGFEFARAFEGRLALGDPSHVPAGIYAKEALKRLGWWKGVKDRLAVGHDARTALAYVERGACPAGVVYATDAAMSSGVAIVARLPRAACHPIEYPVALVKGRGRPAVDRLMKYLQSEAAETVFRSFGFEVLNRPQ